MHVLPNPQRIVIPLVTLLLGAAGGATVAAIVADDEIVINRPSADVSTQTQAPSQARPQEGAAARAMSQPAPSVTSEKASDPSVTFGKQEAPGLSEKSSDPSLSDPSHSLQLKGSTAAQSSQNSLGARP